MPRGRGIYEDEDRDQLDNAADESRDAAKRKEGGGSDSGDSSSVTVEEPPD